MIVLWTALALAQTATLISTGATNGIGGSTWDLGGSLEAMDIESVEAMHGVMARGDAILIAKNGRVESLRGVLDGAACSDPQPAVVRQTEYDLIVATSGEGDPYSRWSCGDAWWIAPEGEEPTDDRSGFDFRLTLRVTTTTENLFLVGVPVDDAARRVARLLELKALHPDALFVDSGSFVDGISTVRDGTPNLHRPALFGALRRLKPAALVPGATELASGARYFLDEAGDLPYIATNWSTTEPDLEIPASMIVEVTDGDQTLKLAFLSVVDPELMREIPALVTEGISLLDPVESVKTELENLDVDLVVLLTEGRRSWLADLERLPGVDIVIGDPGPPIDRVTSFDVHIAAGRSTAWTMSIDGIGVNHLYLDDQGLHRIVGYPEVPWVDQTPDPEVLKRVNKIRFRDYPMHDLALLPAPTDAPTQALSQATWDKIICEAVLEYTDADVALLPMLPPATPIPGPLTELLVLDHLGLRDVLEVHYISGDALRRVLDKAYQMVPVTCGANPGAASPAVGGRGIDSLRTYSIVTTDRARLSPSFEGMIAAAHSAHALHLPGWKTVTDKDGPVTLRRAALNVFQRHHEDNPVAVLTARSAGDKLPLWLLRVDHAALSIVSFKGAENTAYEMIPETLANSPSSLTLLADLDMGLDYTSKRFDADLRNRTSFSRLVTGGEESEPADDVRISSSGSLPAATVQVGLPWYPYGEMLFDSELTPVKDEFGVRGNRQADLSLTAGITTSKGRLSKLRIGTFALQELSNIGKLLEGGGRTEVTTSFGFGPGLKWISTADAYVFWNTADQDETDLRFKVLVDTRLDLPLARWLSIAPWGQAFAFAGRVPETSQPGLALTTGVALNIAGAFTL